MVFTALNIFTLASLCGLAYAAILLYNHLEAARQEVEKAFASIDTLLAQRRAELPNLAELCRGNMEFEQLHARLSGLRSRCETPALHARLGAENLFAALFLRALAASEGHPELKSPDRLRDLRRRVTDLETRIAARREYFNAAAAGYNTWIAQFPLLLFARACGHRKIPLLNQAPA